MIRRRPWWLSVSDPRAAGVPAPLRTKESVWLVRASRWASFVFRSGRIRGGRRFAPAGLVGAASWPDRRNYAGGAPRNYTITPTFRFADGVTTFGTARL